MDATSFANSIKWKVEQDMKVKDLTLIDHNLGKSGDYQQGILGFLDVAYDNNLAIELRPEVLWCAILYRCSQIVGDDPKTYQPLFTHSTNDKKIVIRVTTGNPGDLSTYIEQITGGLRSLVPSGLANHFLPKFQCEPEAVIAHHAAFADIAKNYYEYEGMQGCQGGGAPPRTRGIAEVKLGGTPAEWRTIWKNWMVISEVVGRYGEFSTTPFALATKTILEALANDAPQSWLRGIYTNTKTGWIHDITGRADATRFAQVPYNEVSITDESKTKYILVSGLFSRKLVDGVLVPSFGHIIFLDASPNEARPKPEAEWVGYPGPTAALNQITEPTMQADQNGNQGGYTHAQMYGEHGIQAPSYNFPRQETRR